MAFISLNRRYLKKHRILFSALSICVLSVVLFPALLAEEFGGVAHTPQGVPIQNLDIHFINKNSGNIDFSYMTGADGRFGNFTSIDWAEDPNQSIPRTVFLSHNFPEPFNPGTSVYIRLDRPQNVRIDILDLRGFRVSTLYDGIMREGTNKVSWNGMNKVGRYAAAGFYFLRLKTECGVFVEPLVKNDRGAVSRTESEITLDTGNQPIPGTAGKLSKPADISDYRLRAVNNGLTHPRVAAVMRDSLSTDGIIDLTLDPLKKVDGSVSNHWTALPLDSVTIISYFGKDTATTDRYREFRIEASSSLEYLIFVKQGHFESGITLQPSLADENIYVAPTAEALSDTVIIYGPARYEESGNVLSDGFNTIEQINAMGGWLNENTKKITRGIL